MGSGVVGFNLAPGEAILGDLNPHTIAFYEALRSTPLEEVREYLVREGAELARLGERHYYVVRDRFNREHSPLDLLFLNRTGFNGLMRFNNAGEYNVPFCHRPLRFINLEFLEQVLAQVAFVQERLARFSFVEQSFEKTIALAGAEDFIYCDPPYLERNTNYFNNGWEMDQEEALYEALCASPAPFILSTWYREGEKVNSAIERLWGRFNMVTREHTYMIAADKTKRGKIEEALIYSALTRSK